ncbi:hypothetical protein B0H19DRAFT_1057780 [Mycena capillaripes]|nr:hypothetical protein B0H19DRAFT_1057780 [Mycena capillaripes]
MVEYLKWMRMSFQTWQEPEVDVDVDMNPPSVRSRPGRLPLASLHLLESGARDKRLYATPSCPPSAVADDLGPGSSVPRPFQFGLHRAGPRSVAKADHPSCSYPESLMSTLVTPALFCTPNVRQSSNEFAQARCDEWMQFRFRVVPSQAPARVPSVGGRVKMKRVCRTCSGRCPTAFASIIPAKRASSPDGHPASSAFCDRERSHLITGVESAERRLLGMLFRSVTFCPASFCPALHAVECITAAGGETMGRRAVYGVSGGPWSSGAAVSLWGRAAAPKSVGGNRSKICQWFGSTPTLSGGERFHPHSLVEFGRHECEAPRNLRAGKTGERTAQARSGVTLLLFSCPAGSPLRRPKTWLGRHRVMGQRANVFEIHDHCRTLPKAHVRKDSKTVETGTEHFAAARHEGDSNRFRWEENPRARISAFPVVAGMQYPQEHSDVSTLGVYSLDWYLFGTAAEKGN